MSPRKSADSDSERRPMLPGVWPGPWITVSPAIVSPSSSRRAARPAQVTTNLASPGGKRSARPHKVMRSFGRRVGLVHGETRTRRLAECERGAGVIDVVMREDDPIDAAQALLLDESTHRAEAAGIARVDDGETVAAVVQIGLCAAHARDPMNHGPIIGLSGGSEARRVQGIRGGLTGEPAIATEEQPGRKGGPAVRAPAEVDAMATHHRLGEGPGAPAPAPRQR